MAKRTRTYGLFFKAGKRWVRLYPKLEYRKPTAIRLFQTLLIGLSMRGKNPRLRPVGYLKTFADLF